MLLVYSYSNAIILLYYVSVCICGFLFALHYLGMGLMRTILDKTYLLTQSVSRLEAYVLTARLLLKRCIWVFRK